MTLFTVYILGLATFPALSLILTALTGGGRLAWITEDDAIALEVKDGSEG